MREFANQEATTLSSFGNLNELLLVLTPYQLELKLAFLLIASLIAFVVGRLSQNNDLERSLNKLNNAQYFKNELNKDLALTKKRIVSVGKIARLLMVIIVIIVLTLLASLSKVAGDYIPTRYLLYILVVLIVVYLLMLGYRRLLVNREKKQTLRLNNIAIEEDKEVDKVIRAIGEKLSGRLKTRLEAIEKDTFEKNKKKQCDLYKCRQTKRLLKDAAESFEKIVTELTTHKWCTKCAEQQTTDTSYLKVDLSGVKTEGLELEDLKRQFNRLLEIYNEKKKELDRSCAEECAKGFCENLRNLSKRFYEKVSSCEKKLEDLKSTR